MGERKGRVAVIDDDDEFAALMQALLDEEGYAYLRPSLRHDDPIEQMATQGVDVAIVDLHGVADGGGLALLHRIRAHPRLEHLPVLVCSADIQLLREHAGDLVRIPGVAALEKPFRIDALIGALERLLAGSLHHPAFGSTPDPAVGAALDSLLARLGAGLRWPVLDAWTPDTRPGMLRCAAAWAATPRLAPFTQVSRRTLLPFGGGLPGRIWVSGRSAWIERLDEDLNFPRLRTARRVGLVSAAAAPVVDAGAVVGVVAAYDQRMRRRDDRELERLESAAVEAAATLRSVAGLSGRA